MPGTLNVGGHDIITHSGDAGAGDVTVNVQNRLVLDSSGNVGIGTSLSGNSENKFTIRKDSATNVVDALLLNNGSADNQTGTGVRINMSGISEANSDIRYAYIEAATLSAGNDHYLAFGTNVAGSEPTERMRITSTGDVEYPWSNTANYKLGVAQSPTNAFFTNTSVLEIHGADPLSGAQAMGGGDVKIRGGKGYGTAAGAAGDVILEAGSSLGGSAIGGIIQFKTGSTSTERMRIDSSGNVKINNLGTGTVYSNSGTLTNTNPSDLNLKENVVEVSYGLSEVKQLRPVEFDWIADEADKHELGFIAQEVQLIIPALVNTYERTNAETGEAEIGYGLESTQFIPVLVKAIQEQQSIIEALTTRIEALENA